jgi:hypothetical protein
MPRRVKSKTQRKTWHWYATMGLNGLLAVSMVLGTVFLFGGASTVQSRPPIVPPTANPLQTLVPPTQLPTIAPASPTPAPPTPTPKAFTSRSPLSVARNVEAGTGMRLSP